MNPNTWGPGMERLLLDLAAIGASFLVLLAVIGVSSAISKGVHITMDKNELKQQGRAN